MNTEDLRHEHAEAARIFVMVWAELLVSLPDDYDCHLNCSEADAAVELLRVFGYTGSADELARAHAEHDDPGDGHAPATPSS